MMKLIALAVSCVVLLAPACFSLSTKKCYLTPTAEKVTLDRDTCVYTVGETATANVTFKAGSACKTLSANLMGTENVFTDEKACSSLVGSTCPLTAGQEYTYQFKVPIVQKLVGGLDLVFTLHNEEDKVVTCYLVECQIKAKA